MLNRLLPSRSTLKRHFGRRKMIYRIFGFIGFTSFLTAWLDFPWYAYPFTAAFFGLAYYAGSGGWRHLKNVFLTLGRDFRCVKSLLLLKLDINRRYKNKETIPNLFSKIVAKYPNKNAFILADNGESLTFTEVDATSNKVGNFFANVISGDDDEVALFMESTPLLVCYWLGLAKIGTVSALINYNLRGDSLLHSINITKAKSLVYSEGLADAVFEIKDSIKDDIKLFCVGSDKHNENSQDLQTLLQPVAATLPPLKKEMNFLSKLFYIYTSGTTGLPKAAIIRHSRFFMMGKGLYHLLNIKSSDVMYDSLPLYHTNGGILGIAATLLSGSTTVIRKRFSASKFFEDCKKYDATVINYIGETCRYLLAQPMRDFDTQHKVRLAFGNGLRPQIWNDFTKRFNIRQIGEFYGATEGNASMVNIDSTVGAVGFNSILVPSVLPIKIVRVDQDTGEIVRGSDGLAVACEYNEPGELLSRIIKDDPTRSFDGYISSQATSKKIVRDIFYHGDAAFRTGDVLFQDERGYLYFHDRTGDTFRWKGENVSTAEVEYVISKIINLGDVVVYGVDIPGTEGKAGMAAIFDPDDQVDMTELSDELKTALPAYARPIFIRKLKTSVQTTGTYKFQKNQLRKEAYNLSLIDKDSLFFFDPATKNFQELNQSMYKKISNGQIRL